MERWYCRHPSAHLLVCWLWYHVECILGIEVGPLSAEPLVNCLQACHCFLQHLQFVDSQLVLFVLLEVVHQFIWTDVNFVKYRHYYLNIFYAGFKLATLLLHFQLYLQQLFLLLQQLSRQLYFTVDSLHLTSPLATCHCHATFRVRASAAWISPLFPRFSAAVSAAVLPAFAVALTPQELAAAASAGCCLCPALAIWMSFVLLLCRFGRGFECSRAGRRQICFWNRVEGKSGRADWADGEPEKYRLQQEQRVEVNSKKK